MEEMPRPCRMEKCNTHFAGRSWLRNTREVENMYLNTSFDLSARSMHAFCRHGQSCMHAASLMVICPHVKEVERAMLPADWCCSLDADVPKLLSAQERRAYLRKSLQAAVAKGAGLLPCPVPDCPGIAAPGAPNVIPSAVQSAESAHENMHEGSVGSHDSFPYCSGVNGGIHTGGRV